MSIIYIRIQRPQSRVRGRGLWGSEEEVIRYIYSVLWAARRTPACWLWVCGSPYTSRCQKLSAYGAYWWLIFRPYQHKQYNQLKIHALTENQRNGTPEITDISWSLRDIRLPNWNTNYMTSVAQFKHETDSLANNRHLWTSENRNNYYDFPTNQSQSVTKWICTAPLTILDSCRFYHLRVKTVRN